MSFTKVHFSRRQASKYIRIAEELGGEMFTDSKHLLNSIAINKLYTLASAPEEVKEDVANSKPLYYLADKFIVEIIKTS